MSDELISLIGLEREEVAELKARVERRFISFEMMPKVQLRDHRLYVARFGTWDWAGPVEKVVFHGIFEDDLPGLAALALWRGVPTERLRVARLPTADRQSGASSSRVHVRRAAPLVHRRRHDVPRRRAVGREVGRVALW